MRRLENVTLLAIDTAHPGKAAASLYRSLKQIIPDKVLLFTNVKMELKGIEVIQIPDIRSKDDYSRFMLKQLAPFIETDYVLVSQHDSWVLNGDEFPDELYQFDYAGALWVETDGLENGNGGFSWRSKKLMDVIYHDTRIEVLCPEDVSVCRIYRRYLEQEYGLKWAPNDICERFSFECKEPTHKTFGFHNFFHQPFKEVIVVRRTAACGDVVQVEPVLRYFYEQGYRVFLDTLDQFFYLFIQHEYRIDHFSNLPKGMPYRLVDLDMAYEWKPDQLHLKSYYEAAGIEDGPLRNPKLNFNIHEGNRLFGRYAIIHIDKRQPYRSIFGVDWKQASDKLKEKGLNIIQIGDGESEDVPGATRMKCATLNLLQYVVAGCELFVGIDSGPSNIALAFNKPMIIFHGSVDPDIIYPDQTNVYVITNHDKETPICEHRYCWSEVIGGVEGKQCVVNESAPPCTQYNTKQVLHAINEML